MPKEAVVSWSKNLVAKSRSTLCVVLSLNRYRLSLKLSLRTFLKKTSTCGLDIAFSMSCFRSSHRP